MTQSVSQESLKCSKNTIYTVMGMGMGVVLQLMYRAAASFVVTHYHKDNGSHTVYK